MVLVNSLNSTMKPTLSNPMARTMIPQMNARQTAICGALYSSPNLFCTLAMMLPVSRLMTATGPIETSFEVAKKAYVRTPMKDE